MRKQEGGNKTSVQSDKPRRVEEEYRRKTKKGKLGVQNKPRSVEERTGEPRRVKTNVRLTKNGGIRVHKVKEENRTNQSGRKKSIGAGAYWQ